ncbi:NusB family protein [Wigglesworthia glossinidia endosymbiont of Glossina morsitans morsitans (Yale colony)]|uniref:NusB family protein n=1 Tax=Wigglesworthia glossinidia endosymbiont of Glossina morsitans morsitans (Yale colony) TaxID=1142511 RepID=H6Q5T7_WIGGL|nr:NusB family protein [Wigglesworthia glossinidia endosymbiont of Glossina morsitans morsitans (Yale colony)]
MSTYRRHARQCALQALYSWQVSNNNILEIQKYVLLNKKKMHRY